jgi:polo-like kinase 1
MNEENDITQNNLLEVQEDVIIEKIPKNTDEFKIKKYKKVRILGRGGFALCYEVMDIDTNHSSAVKIIPKRKLIKSRAKQKLINEIKIHKSIQHEHIVNFEHYFEDANNVYILIELCHNQTLHELLRRRKNLTELEVQYYIFQLVKCLQYLHGLKIIHRDLKLANLFISENMQLKLGDFGLATRIDFEGERKRTLCGTPNYTAPEILDGKTGHSFEVDIWSIGIIVYILLIGRAPFEANNIKETYKRIRLKNYSFPQNAKISKPAKEFIESILLLEPYKRPSLEEILKSDFMNMGVGIPQTMPQSTLACPPNINFIKEYMPDAGPDGIIVNFISKKPKKKIRLEDFASQYIAVQSANGVFSNKIIGTLYNQNNLYMNGYQQPNLVLLNTSEIFLRKWVEVEKYGLGYILSNENVGVYFNDNTKIIYKPNGRNFIYIGNDEKIYNYLFNQELTKDLSKKITLLKNFKGYLFEETKDTKELNIYEGINEHLFFYLKRFVKTKHAILFKLSNKTIQTNFHDNTELIINPETKTVTYIDKKKQKLLYPINIALECNNKEMTKRLRYTKKILVNMLLIQNNDIHKVII